MRTTVAATLVFLSLAGLPAQAQIFRWVDERGVVNYASAPPAGVRATPVDTGGQPPVPSAPSAARSLLPRLPLTVASAPPGDVDRATLNALGRALEARRIYIGQRRMPSRDPGELHAQAQHSLPLAP
jgi:Domain of unknown function (DUF4124)